MMPRLYGVGTEQIAATLSNSRDWTINEAYRKQTISEQTAFVSPLSTYRGTIIEATLSTIEANIGVNSSANQRGSKQFTFRKRLPYFERGLFGWKCCSETGNLILESQLKQAISSSLGNSLGNILLESHFGLFESSFKRQSQQFGFLTLNR